jgi:hypothetical protein
MKPTGAKKKQIQNKGEKGGGGGRMGNKKPNIKGGKGKKRNTKKGNSCTKNAPLPFIKHLVQSEDKIEQLSESNYRHIFQDFSILQWGSHPDRSSCIPSFFLRHL